MPSAFFILGTCQSEPAFQIIVGRALAKREGYSQIAKGVELMDPTHRFCIEPAIVFEIKFYSTIIRFSNLNFRIGD